jgi:signal transduction histidine kinase/CheY-like chemotaxis protein
MDKTCLDYYNLMYNAHMNKTPYPIYINNFLDKMLNLLNIDRSGFIVHYNSTSNSLYNLNISRKNIKIDQFDVSYKPVINLDYETCILKDCIKNKQPIIQTNSTYKELFGSVFDNPNINFKVNSLLIPILHSSHVKGILGFVTTTQIKENILQDIYNLQYLLGTLFYSIEMSGQIVDDTYSSNKFLVYQILGDVLNLVDDGILIINSDYNISYHNEMIESIFNELEVQVDKIIEKNIIDVIPEYYFLISDNKQYFKNKRFTFEKNNCKIESEINSIIIGEDICHVIIIKKNNDKDSLSNGANSTKNLMAYLSHELRNPLQAISNGCFVLQARVDCCKKITEKKERNEIEHILSNMNRNCRDMCVIIDDILDLTKLNAKEYCISLEICDIKELVETLLLDFEPLASEKNLILKSQISDDSPKTLYTDETRIYQILSNLISNAIKYSDTGTIVICVYYDEEEHGVIFKISDEGKGIKQHEVANLFKDFGQTSNSFCKKSTGLGLCISQKIANLLGGNISVDAEYKKGSTFKLYHPIKLGSSNSSLDTGKPQTPINGKILVVDDEEYNASIFKMLLLSFNYKYGCNLSVDLVFTGEKAIYTVNNCDSYDIIFMDINMDNGIDGCTTCQILRNNGVFNGPIIATTGDIMATDINRKDSNNICKKFDMFTDILLKPFKWDAILEILNKYI